MNDALKELREAIELERIQQQRRAAEWEGRVEALQRQVEALKAALAQRAETAEHPIAALTMDVSSLDALARVAPRRALPLNGVRSGPRPSPREVLKAVCAVRLVDANRAALGLLKMSDLDELMDRAGEVFRADLIEPLARFSRALSADAETFRCMGRLHDGAGAALTVELRAAITRNHPEALCTAPIRHVTFAVIDAPAAFAPQLEAPRVAAPIQELRALALAPEPAQNAANDLAREAA